MVGDNNEKLQLASIYTPPALFEPPAQVRSLDRAATILHYFKLGFTFFQFSSWIYEGWNFNFGNTPLDWIQELLE